jgi:Protein of unknown function (DUF3631)/RepB DNA-primase from phage plasmid
MTAPDLDQARRFLALLDDGADAFTFQTFDDGPQKRGHLARVAHGDLESEAARLTAWQKAGAGVFVTVNETDGMGRKAENIVRVRSVFCDLDGAPADPVLRCALTPHVLAESSSGRFHAYWFVDDLPLDQFAGVQKAIAARFNGDPSVHDLSRVMRCVGFLHQKAEPFLCRIVHEHVGQPYKAAQILEAFPPIRTNSKGNGADGDHEATETAELVRRILSGEQYHDAIRDLAWRFFRKGMPAGEVIATLRGLLEAAVPAAKRDDRWRARYAEIGRTVETAVKKQRPEGEAGETFEQATARLAQLPPHEYDRGRKAEADRLGVRVATLDAAVEAIRSTEREDSAAKGKALDLPEPEPWSEPVGGVLDDLIAVIRKYVSLDERKALAVALWAIHAHCMEWAYVAPRLHVTSPAPNCGKTVLLDAVARLVPRPLLISNISPAGIFRTVEACRPTMLVDEFDAFGTEDEQLRGLVNSGHTRTSAFVIRVVDVGGDLEPRRFSTWGALAVAGIGKVPATIASRSIVIEMERKLPGDRVARLTHRGGHDLDVLCRKVARWTADNRARLEAATPDVPAQLSNRNADNWAELLTIAALHGDVWAERARRAALSLTRTDSDDAGYGIALLEDIKTAIGKAEQISTDNLLRSLHAMTERPWCEYGRARKPITPRQLASLLRPFGIASGTIRESEISTPKGYRREQFESAWDRYLSATAPQPRQSATFSDFSSATNNPVVADRDSENSRRSAACGAVADGKEESGGYERERVGQCPVCRFAVFADNATQTGGGVWLHPSCVS